MRQHVQWAVQWEAPDGRIITDACDDEAHARSRVEQSSPLYLAKVVRRNVTETDWVPPEPPQDSPDDTFIVPRSWLNLVRTYADKGRQSHHLSYDSSIVDVVDEVLANEPHKRSRS